MNLLVTGANGFLGRYVVAEALRRGHTVRAMVRSAGDAAKHGWDDRVTPVQADLRRRRDLADAVRGVDAVLHLAASKAGDMYAQYAGTVVATENLLGAMDEAGVRRIVAISSFSVYDYRKIRVRSVLSEESPIEADAFDRDEYAHTKLVQERLVRDHATRAGWDYTVIRPGVIFGADNLWTARLGAKGKKLWIRIGAWAKLPLTYVENCAEAIVLSAERDAARGQVINIVDDETPTQRTYFSLLRKQTSPKPFVFPVAYSVMRFLAGAASFTNKYLLGGKAKVPGIFVPAKLVARAKPLNFTNAKAKQVLGWTPKYGVKEALARSAADEAKNRLKSPAAERAGVEKLPPLPTDARAAKGAA